MFKPHIFFPASQIFTFSSVVPQQGMPAFTDLRFAQNPSCDPKTAAGCGLYFFMHHGHLVYIGKFLGTIRDAFGGDIFSARWNRHISTLSLRGSKIAISQANCARAAAQSLPANLLAALQAADPVTLAKDRGFMVPYKRLVYAAQHWAEFSGSPATWLPNIDVGYLQLDPAAWSHRSIFELREVVSQAEKRAIEQIPTVLNGPGEFDAALIKKLSKDQVFDLLESMFNATGHATLKAETDERQAEDANAEVESDFYSERFLESLPSECPEETVAAIKESFEDDDAVQVHHTKTHGGDLRVRALNTPRPRNIFTMYWQVDNELFRCRIKLEPNNVDGAGVVNVKASSAKEPLPTTFWFDCSQPGAIENLLRLIKLALQNI
jgi:hypothetical protein